MRALILFLTVVAAPAAAQKIVYPPSPKGEVVDEYHGTKVQDPYRWLEDGAAKETRAWIEAQNRLTFGYLEKLPARARFRERLTTLWNHEHYGEPPRQAGGRVFFRKNDGLQNQAPLYVVDGEGKAPRLLLDPNTLSSDGTVALGVYAVSFDGKKLAYSTSSGGSDWREWRVRDVVTGKDLPDVIRWSKFGRPAWTRDGKGFFYGAFDPPKAGEELTGVNYFQKLYYHRLGTPQARDRLVHERKDQKEWQFRPDVTDDGRWLVIRVGRGSDPENQLFVKDLSRRDSRVVEVVKGFDDAADLVGSAGTRLFVLTDRDAPLRRVVSIDLSDPTHAWTEVVPEGEHAIVGAVVLNDSLVIHTLRDATSALTVYGLDGARRGELALPGIGTIRGFFGRRTDRETYYLFQSFTAPEALYHVDLVSGESRVFRQPRLAFDPKAFETRQVFYRSKDGTRVPMFLVHREGLPRDGNNPVLLSGYGGFGVSLTPGYSVMPLVWMEAGGVYAVPNLRGGGEYGKAWHDAGSRLAKQNTFDDFIAAAEHLVAEKITRPARIAIIGGSNGGLLVGAVLNQRPDLFGAAVPQVGVMDMLRYHKFTVGWGWAGNYGSSDDPTDFANLLKYSPLHNVKRGTTYPPVLITTADHDDRVVPAHSFKYAAAMQAAQAGAAPVLIRIDTRAGHGAGKPTDKKIALAADTLAFIAHALGMKL
jgi:prolyl oligopeptidase